MTPKRRFPHGGDDRNEQMARVVLAIVFIGLTLGMVLMWWT